MVTFVVLYEWSFANTGMQAGVVHLQFGSGLWTQWPKRRLRALARLELGNTSNVKGVGAGVFELKVGFGPGYRVYFGKDGDEIVILLGGGTKKRQQRDIEAAQDCWQDYKDRKKGKI